MSKLPEIAGFSFGAAAAGVKRAGSDRLDVGVIRADGPVAAAAVFTSNRVKAAPVIVSAERVRKGKLRGVVVNAGNANACTGARGLMDARSMAAAAAKAAGGAATEWAVCSTGVIGVPLPMERVTAGIAAAAAELAPGGFDRFARAILTTDQAPKVAMSRLRLGRRDVVVAGCTKGAGMIAPNMATTLGFVCTDAAVDPRWLRRLVAEEADRTYNCVSVDGDTSTNDSLFLFASGAAGNAPIRTDASSDARRLRAAVHEVLLALALQIARDGEGATKLVRIAVRGAPTDDAARAVARRIAGSPLVKTAFFGADPNWGRILCAIGNAGVSIDPARVDVAFDDVLVVRRGLGVTADGTEERAHAVMTRAEYTIHVSLGRGRGSAQHWTCDLGHNYVNLNADYRS